MADVVLMPKVGISVESCIITEWVKKPGDQVAEGDILFSYETDKSSLECESTLAGVLLEQFFGPGDEVPVLTPVCAIGVAGEDVSSLRPGAAQEGPAPAAAGAVAPAAQSAAAPGRPDGAEAAVPETSPAGAGPMEHGQLKISPRAKNLAEKHHLDVSAIPASGPYGRVIERDVHAALDSGTAAQRPADAAAAQSVAPAQPVALQKTAAEQEYEDVKFSGIRKVISQSMAASLATIPQLTHNFSFDATEILALRAKIKAKGEEMGLPSITLNDFILFTVSRLLPKYPELNAHMLDGVTMRKFKNVNLGMAVDTPRGLMVPVIHNANLMSLAELSQAAKSLAKQAQEGTLSPDYMTGGTFTVSNLGALNVESFTPVINPPETGILGVDNIIQRPRAGKDGGIELYPAMGISLTYDHRAIDGAPASRFASEVCRTLETFTLLLAR